MVTKLIIAPNGTATMDYSTYLGGVRHADLRQPSTSCRSTRRAGRSWPARRAPPQPARRCTRRRRRATCYAARLAPARRAATTSPLRVVDAPRRRRGPSEPTQQLATRSRAWTSTRPATSTCRARPTRRDVPDWSTPTTGDAQAAGATYGWPSSTAATDPSVGATIDYVTFLGGSDLDQTAYVAAGPDGAAYVLGDSFGDRFPHAATASRRHRPTDDFNAVLAKIEPHTTGNAQLGYATLLPVDALRVRQGRPRRTTEGGVYVALFAFSTDLPGPCSVPGIDFQHPVDRARRARTPAVDGQRSTGRRSWAGPATRAAASATSPHGIAPNGADAVYVVGSTRTGYPTVDAAQAAAGGVGGRVRDAGEPDRRGLRGRTVGGRAITDGDADRHGRPRRPRRRRQ